MVTVIAISASVSAIATLVISVYAVKAHSLSKVIQSSQNEFREGVSDLYKAIVISNLLGTQIGYSEGDVNSLIDNFNLMYKRAKGKTEIFEKR